jgi:ABC-type spermidine/putrescine transport system permease subunit II
MPIAAASLPSCVPTYSADVVAVAGDRAVEALIVASIVVPMIALAIVCWIFWKAAKRDRES